jgi:hypothetical protein
MSLPKFIIGPRRDDEKNCVIFPREFCDGNAATAQRRGMNLLLQLVDKADNNKRSNGGFPAQKDISARFWSIGLQSLIVSTIVCEICRRRRFAARRHSNDDMKMKVSFLR